MLPETPIKKKPLEQFKAWIRHHPVWTYTLVGIGLVVAGGLTTLAILWQQPQKADEQTPKKMVKTAPKPVYYAPLTGEPLQSKDSVSKPVTAIMIENSPAARPQSGLRDAEVVYEAIAEGGITRFLALYQQRQPELVGPVRSLRLYYVDWVTPYDASIAHIGGSKAALQLVRGGGYRDIDQFFNAASYWRSTDRAAPHNVYTSFSRLNALNAQKGYATSNPKVIERADDPKDAPQEATQISIDISGPAYNSSYNYDAATKLYARSQAGAPHLDRESGQIQARVVVVLRVSMDKIMEDGYRESITTSGTGEAVIFQNGQRFDATWHKDDRSGQLRFTNPAGQPIKLARGTTWISAVPVNGGDLSWQ